MTTEASARLIKGARVLTLSSGRYALGLDFVPPDAALEPNIASGTSANRSEGGVKVGERARDREWRFSIFIQNCASEREVVQAARDLRQFLALAGDEQEPLYLEYRASPHIAALPLWGHGGQLRYEIIHGTLQLSDMYATSDLRGRQLPACPVRLTIKPYAIGRRQRLMSACGGVFPDQLGVPDAFDRGTIIAPSSVNEFLNPIFGLVTWEENGWTAAACLLVSKNTNPAYTLPFAVNSALLTSKASASNTYTQPLTLANGSPYVISAWVKLLDGGPAASEVVQLVRGESASSGSYFDWGDGWWEVSGSVAGTGAASPVGVAVQAGHTIYLGGMQTSSSRREPLCHGDLLGHVFDTSSLRANGRLRISASPDVFSPGQGALVTVWTPYHDSSYPLDRYLFSAGSQQLRLHFEASSDTFRLNDGSASIATPAQTFNTGCPLHLAATWGPAGLFLFLNGQCAASLGSYTLAASPADYFYLGTDHAGSQHATGTFGELRFYDQQPSADEIQAEAAQVAPLLANRQRVGDFPWMWSERGDDTTANHDDADAGHTHWVVVAGIPGAAPARTEFRLQTEATGSLWLGLAPLTRFASPGRLFYKDFSGSANGDSSGSAHNSQDVGTTVQTLGGTMHYVTSDYALVQGREMYFFLRCADSASGLTIAPRMYYNDSFITAITGDFVPVSASTDMKLFRTRPFVLPRLAGQFADPDVVVKPVLEVAGGHISESGTVRTDFLALMPRPLLNISLAGGLGVHLVFNGRQAAALDFGNPQGLLEPLRVTGDRIEFEPACLNVLLALQDDTGKEHTITDALTYTTVWITPRWGLL